MPATFNQKLIESSSLKEMLIDLFYFDSTHECNTQRIKQRIKMRLIKLNKDDILSSNDLMNY